MPSTRESLMIVEDDAGLRGQLRWCFPDYDVVFAEDRPSALDALRRHRPAVVLLDLGLPPIPQMHPKACEPWMKSSLSRPTRKSLS